VEVKAIVRHTGFPARKVRPIVNLVRGKKVEEALTLLKFMPTPKAQVVAKLVQSAAANAENNYQMATDNLKIIKIFADDAPFLRRFRPRSRGRASSVQKRSSHITVIVSEQEG
jgi:large subunit ribosomal protein L22